MDIFLSLCKKPRTMSLLEKMHKWSLNIWFKYFTLLTYSPFLFPSTLTQAAQKSWPRNSNPGPGTEDPTDTGTHKAMAQNTKHSCTRSHSPLHPPAQKYADAKHLKVWKQNISHLGYRVDGAWALEPMRPEVTSLPIILTWTNCLSWFNPHLFFYL